MSNRSSGNDSLISIAILSHALRIRLAFSAGLLIFALSISACGSSDINLGNTAVESAVKSALEQEGISVAAVTCSGPLPTKVGQATHCVYNVSNGAPIGAIATVTDVQSGEIAFDVAAEPVSMPANFLAASLTTDIANSGNGKTESSTCSNDLGPVAGTAVECSVTLGGERFDVTVTTSGVTGGLIDYTYSVKHS